MRLQRNKGRKEVKNVYHSSVHGNNQDIAETNTDKVKQNTGSNIYPLLLFTFLFYSLLPLICGCGGNLVDAVATNSSVNRSEFQSLRFTIPLKNKSEITNTSGSSISNVNEICFNLSCTYGVNVSEIFLLLSKNLTDKMHFDFCSDIPMQYALNTSKNFNIASLLSNTCNQQSNNTISLPASNLLSCAEIQNLYKIDKGYEQSFKELQSVYDRYTYCYTDHDNDDLLDLQHCNEDCKSCMVRYFVSAILSQVFSCSWK